MINTNPQIQDDNRIVTTPPNEREKIHDVLRTPAQQFSSPEKDPKYNEKFKKYDYEINSNPKVQELIALRSIESKKVENILDIIKQTNTNYVTRLIRIAQKICSFAAKAISVIGWLVAITSFVSLLTDPSPSFILLSILKGVGLGVIMGQLGPILSTAFESFFKWLEVRWTQYQYFSPLEADGDLAETLDILREWHNVKDKIKDYYPLIMRKHKNIVAFEKKHVCKDDHGATKNMLDTQLRKIESYDDSVLTIKYRMENCEGGKQINDYLENRSLYAFLTQKV